MCDGLSIKNYFFGIDDDIICFYLDQVEDLYASMMPCNDDSVWIPEDKLKCLDFVHVFGSMSEAVRSKRYDDVDLSDPFITFLLNDLLSGILSGDFCQYHGTPW
jgi:hypothetical protein